MAIRKFLFMNGSEGFAQEQGSLDELSLGKLTLVGVEGVAVDAGSAKIVNLGAPVSSTDAARKSEVDAAALAATQAIAAEAAARQSADTTLQSNIDAEAGARQAADSALQSAITAEASARAAADVTLQSNIDAEAAARQSADTSLQNAITAATTQAQQALAAEQAARIAADNTLQSNIDAEALARAAADTSLQNALTAEVSARTAADTTLQSNIDAEALARAAADTSLQNAITAEAAARESADTALQGAINTAVSNAQAALAAEQAARIAADGTLQGNIDAEAAARAAADTSLQNALTAEVSARTAADVTLQSNIDAEAAARLSADTALQAAITAEASARVSGDAATLASAQSYTDSVAAGFYVKAPVKAMASASITLEGEQTVDGVSLVAGDRVLVAGQGTSADNGIYVVAAGAWARSPDANTDAEVKDGMSVWVEQGTVNADSTWVLVSNNPIVLGTTPLEFRQFSGLGQIVAGAGLDKTGNTLSVNVGSGVEILNDAVAVKLAAAAGLMFYGDALGVKADSARGLNTSANGLWVMSDSTKGLAMDSVAGLQVKLESDAGMEFDVANGGLELKLVSDDRLSKSASGLDVTGVPSLFKIGGSAVSANVTATNLNTLTAGPSSNADANHGHAALRTTLGGTGFVVGDPVYMTGINSIGKAAANSSSTARVVGIPVTSLGSNQYMVVSHGVVTGSWGLTVGTPYYLGRDGGIAEFSALQSGDRVIRLGYGLNYAMLMLNIQDMGQKA